mmetsp:Transcript_7681/g.8922  ORF Transcript_7681/g.8922 Transcript_7681/m.8922 type:complete len:99 (+) Transcript_7681:958-1254(+)
MSTSPSSPDEFSDFSSSSLLLDNKYDPVPTNMDGTAAADATVSAMATSNNDKEEEEDDDVNCALGSDVENALALELNSSNVSRRRKSIFKNLVNMSGG